MKHALLAFTAMFVLSVHPAPAAVGAPDCSRLEARRAALHQQMRRPHGVAQANRLHQRLRELNATIARQCH